MSCPFDEKSTNNEMKIFEDNGEIFDKEKIYELKYVKFIIKDYSSFPRTERAKLLLYLINIPMKIIDLEQRFGHIIHAFKFSPVPKNFDNTMQFEITEKTDICFYYLEYRLLFFFDLSQSMLVFDLRQRIFNIEKMERYLLFLLKSCSEYEDTLFSFNLEKIKYKPKVICTIAYTSNEEEISFIKHSFILEKEKFNNYYSKEISNNINLILMKYNDIKKTENQNQILFSYKILENCLLTFNLMPSSGNRILFLLTDGNIFFPHLGKYNNILMQFNRVDISIQIIDMFHRNNFYGLTSPKFVNDIEINKYLARFTGGNYINENLFIKLFFPKEGEKGDKNKKDRFFYPTLYPNILSYNLNLQESEYMWQKRFNDAYDEKLLHCEYCNKGFELFLCKKIIVDKSQNDPKEFVLHNKNQITNLLDKGINIQSIGLLSNNKRTVMNKEVFESYKLKMSLAIIIESRLRESFYLKKTKNKKKIKFIIYLLPGIMIKYNLTKLRDLTKYCSDFQVDIIIKGEISKMTKMKKDLYFNKLQNEKVNLILNFIKQIICTDKISKFFSEIIHHPNFLDEDFFTKNNKYTSKLNSLPVRNWHRFFNVMMCETFIINNAIKVNREFIQNFLKSDELSTKKYKQKQEYLKKKIFAFCDYYNEEINFGIKKISKEENIFVDFSHNGFMLIYFDWNYKNLCLVYLGFFNCFLTVRNKYYNKFKDFISNNNNDSNDNENNNEFIVNCNDGKHLTYFIPEYAKESQLNDDQEKNNLNNEDNSLENKIKTLYSDLNKVEDYKNIANSIFTYIASEKLVGVYLKKFPLLFQFCIETKSELINIIENLIFQRLKEKFRILDWDSNKMIFFSYLTKLNINLDINNSVLDYIKTDPIINNIIVLYKIKLKKENDKYFLITKLIFEQNDNLYILTNDKTQNDNENKNSTEKNESKDKSYFIAIMKYFQEEEKKQTKLLN